MASIENSGQKVRYMNCDISIFTSFVLTSLMHGKMWNNDMVSVTYFYFWKDYMEADVMVLSQGSFCVSGQPMREDVTM